MAPRSPDPDITIHGLAVAGTLAGFKILPSLGTRYLMKHGMVKSKDERIDPDAWYSHAGWVKVFEDVTREVGPSSTFEMGRAIGGMYPVPPDVRDVPAILKFLDVGYHLAHRKGGKAMFDALTGRITDGIGNYTVRTTASAKELHVVCDNPYPCDFDHGLVTGVAQRVAPKARAMHSGPTCRKNGHDACTYVVSWLALDPVPEEIATANLSAKRRSRCRIGPTGRDGWRQTPGFPVRNARC